MCAQTAKDNVLPFNISNNEEKKSLKMMLEFCKSMVANRFYK